MDLAPDFDEFIGSLTAHGVEFIVVGAYALAFHGTPRFTGDLDIFVRPTLENATSADGPRSVRVPVTDLTPPAILDRRRMLQMGVPPVQIHVMSAISGSNGRRRGRIASRAPLGATPCISWAAQRFCATSAPRVVPGTSPTSTRSSPVATSRVRSAAVANTHQARNAGEAPRQKSN